MGDVAHHRPGLLKDEEISPEFKTSGVVFKMEGMNTVTDILTCAKKMEGKQNAGVEMVSVYSTPIPHIRAFKWGYSLMVCMLVLHVMLTVHMNRSSQTPI